LSIISRQERFLNTKRVEFNLSCAFSQDASILRVIVRAWHGFSKS
jgi:hypothetical protein